MKMTVAASMLVLSAGWMAAQDRMADNLRKGIVEEESQHNLTAAVTDYQKVVAQFDEGRKTAATALFRLAESQRQLHHDDQARGAYERVVREFADQRQLAEQSRAALRSAYEEAMPLTGGGPDQRDLDIAAKQEEARQRYRTALQQQIQLAQGNLERVLHLVDLGSVGQEATNDARMQILELERDLAAFDMGVMPKGK